MFYRVTVRPKRLYDLRSHLNWLLSKNSSWFQGSVDSFAFVNKFWLSRFIVWFEYGEIFHFVRYYLGPVKQIFIWGTNELMKSYKNACNEPQRWRVTSNVTCFKDCYASSIHQRHLTALNNIKLWARGKRGRRLKLSKVSKQLKFK